MSIDSATRGGITINTSRRIHYKVRVPPGVSVSLEGSNGDLTATGIGGTFTASTSNGRITADTTNGTVTLTLPATAGADLSARVTNGAISHENLDLSISESSRRRLDGRLGAGDPPIRLATTNRAIRIIGAR